MTKKALIVVDMQNDFMPGGALGVAGGNEIVPVINKLIKGPFEVIVASKDWHPKDHCSFAQTHGKNPGEVIMLEKTKQNLWPVHCVVGTKGAEFTEKLETNRFERVFHKGTDKSIDSYSAFFDNEHKKSTGLGEFLKEKKVSQIYIAGLTTDYCVKYSVLDARSLGFETYVVMDACRPVNLQPGDADRAINEMRKAGAHIINSSQQF